MEFLYSDDPFSIFLFTLVMIVLFILLLNITMGVITSLVTSEQEYIVQGMIPGNMSKYVPVDPRLDGSVPLDRSKNKSGIEFTWSVWINVNDINMANSSFLHVFNKGEQGGDDNGKNVANNSPGVYLKAEPTTNSISLHVLMNTFGTAASDEIVIPNFPMNKWVNVIIRITNNAFDVYVNGTLATQHILADVPRQNYGSVNIALNGGFTGYLSDLMYFSYALSPGKILAINQKGPNLKMNTSSASLYYAPNYLSGQWYTNNIIT
jgi:hypothetical protein